MFDPNQALPDFQTQELDIKRQRAMADRLRQQAGTPAPTGQMVGNQFVAPSFAQYLPGLLNALQSGYAESQASKAEKDYAQQVAQAKQQVFASLPQATAAIPGRAELPGPPEMEGSPELAAVPETPAALPSTTEILKARMRMAAIPGNEKNADVWAQGMLGEITREDTQTARKEEASAKRQQESVLRMATLKQQLDIEKDKADNVKLGLQERERAAKAQERLEGLMIDAKKEIAAAARSARAGRGGSGSTDDLLAEVGKGGGDFIDETGKKVFMSKVEAARRGLVSAKEGNIDAKTEKAADKTEAAVSNIKSILNEMEVQYGNLDALGGMVDDTRGTAGNVMARLGASGVGQAVGGTIGSKEQTARDTINNAKLRLLMAVKNAENTGVGGLNSNMELKTHLDSLSNVGQSKQTVANTLNQVRAILTKEAAKAGTGSPGGVDTSNPLLR